MPWARLPLGKPKCKYGRSVRPNWFQACAGECSFPILLTSCPGALESLDPMNCMHRCLVAARAGPFPGCSLGTPHLPLLWQLLRFLGRELDLMAFGYQTGLPGVKMPADLTITGMQLQSRHEGLLGPRRVSVFPECLHCEVVPFKNS